MSLHPICIGIDVAKAHLDLFHPVTGHHRIKNTGPAIEQWLQPLGGGGIERFHSTTLTSSAPFGGTSSTKEEESGWFDLAASRDFPSARRVACSET